LIAAQSFAEEKTQLKRKRKLKENGRTNLSPKKGRGINGLQSPHLGRKHGLLTEKTLLGNQKVGRPPRLGLTPPQKG